jgi:hypothetical protein
VKGRQLLDSGPIEGSVFVVSRSVHIAEQARLAIVSAVVVAARRSACYGLVWQ